MATLRLEHVETRPARLAKCIEVYGTDLGLTIRDHVACAAYVARPTARGSDFEIQAAPNIGTRPMVVGDPNKAMAEPDFPR